MDRKRILRISAILAVAGATGFVMQTQDKAPPPQRISAAVTAPPQAPPQPVAAATAEPARADEPIAVAATAMDTPPAPALRAVPEPEIATADPAPCSDDMALLSREGAMLDLGLLATCRPNQRVVIRHAGLVITAKTSAAGTMVATIPALQSPAEVTIAFADGSSVSQTTPVADLARFDRFAVQWMGDDAFQLHAYVAATPGEEGHIHADAPRSVSAAGNFLNRVGDATTDRPLLAAVFTWPAGVAAMASAVTLDVEAAVTDATCGREILGETLQVTAGRLTVRDLTIAMPDCGAVGEFVVLPNPVMTEKLAVN